MTYQGITECPNCGGAMYGVFYTEYELDKNYCRTGRTRRACSHLVCDLCGATEIIDDSYDGPWE